MRSHVLFRKNVHEHLINLLHDPLFVNEVEWIPQRTYKSLGEGWMQFISQPWTADEFWDIMVPCFAFLYCSWQLCMLMEAS